MPELRPSHSATATGHSLNACGAREEGISFLNETLVGSQELNAALGSLSVNCGCLFFQTAKLLIGTLAFLLHAALFKHTRGS